MAAALPLSHEHVPGSCGCTCGQHGNCAGITHMPCKLWQDQASFCLTHFGCLHDPQIGVFTGYSSLAVALVSGAAWGHTSRACRGDAPAQPQAACTPHGPTAACTGAAWGHRKRQGQEVHLYSPQAAFRAHVLAPAQALHGGAHTWAAFPHRLTVMPADALAPHAGAAPRRQAGGAG